MTERKELEYILQQAARQQLLQGEIDRREFLDAQPGGRPRHGRRRGRREDAASDRPSRRTAR